MGFTSARQTVAQQWYNKNWQRQFDIQWILWGKWNTNSEDKYKWTALKERNLESSHHNSDNKQQQRDREVFFLENRKKWVDKKEGREIRRKPFKILTGIDCLSCLCTCTISFNYPQDDLVIFRLYRVIWNQNKRNIDTKLYTDK